MSVHRYYCLVPIDDLEGAKSASRTVRARPINIASGLTLTSESHTSH